MKITFLGTGTSHGVPVIGCECPVCTSSSQKDKRTRASLLIEQGDSCILIDPSADFRQQMLRERVKKIDAVLLTHHHYDHIGGLDDIRPLCRGMAIPFFGNHDTLEEIKRKNRYIFEPGVQKGGGLPRLELHEVCEKPFEAAGLSFAPIPHFHGELPILGFRFQNCAYITDSSQIPSSSLPLLRGLDLLILNALRLRPHPTHFNLSQALEVVNTVRPKQTLFTHICHDLSHSEFYALCPPNTAPAYDGQVIKL